MERRGEGTDDTVYLSAGEAEKNEKLTKKMVSKLSCRTHKRRLKYCLFVGLRRTRREKERKVSSVALQW